MRYLGGKSKIAARLADVISPSLRARGGRLVEPFVGGFNIVPALYSDITEALCSDTHAGVIGLYQAMQTGWLPPQNLSQAEYVSLRNDTSADIPLRTFAAFACSFGGKEWGGYARDKEGLRNFAAEQARFLSRKAEYMDKCKFSVADFASLHPVDSAVYCDPPYANTTGYKSTGLFSHEQFFEWCEDAATNNDVFVSEFTIPDRECRWDVVLEIPRKSSVRRADGVPVTEYLLKVACRS